MEGFSLAKIVVSLYTLITFSGGIPVDVSSVVPKIDDAGLEDRVYAAAMEATDIEVVNGRDGEELVDVGHLNHCKALAYKTLAVLPESHVRGLKELYFYYSPGAHRGYGGAGKILLRCQDMDDAEFVAVLVHEMGHIVDTDVFEGEVDFGESEFMDGEVPIFENDESLDFYRISWRDEGRLLEDAGALDFVSGYGKSNPFEDFAESYAFYVLHGGEFRDLAEEDNELKTKYLFLKEEVFDGEEFDFGEFEVADGEREYDVTVLPYKLGDFLAFN